jgi:hypothetical protein
MMTNIALKLGLKISILDQYIQSHFQICKKIVINTLNKVESVKINTKMIKVFLVRTLLLLMIEPE